MSEGLPPLSSPRGAMFTASLSMGRPKPKQRRVAGDVTEGFTTGSEDPLSSAHVDGALTRWPATGETHTHLAASIHAVVAERVHVVVAEEAKRPPSDLHTPFDATIFDRNERLIQDLCALLSRHFRPYAEAFAALPQAAAKMAAVYERLQRSVLALQDNATAIDREHAAETRAFEQRVAGLQAEVKRLSDTEKALEEVARLREERAALTLRNDETEKRATKLRVAMSEMHEKLVALQHRHVLACGAEERGKVALADMKDVEKGLLRRIEVLDVEKGELSVRGDMLEGELLDARRRADRLAQQVRLFEEKQCALTEELNAMRTDRRHKGHGQGLGHAAPADGDALMEAKTQRKFLRAPTPRPEWSTIAAVTVDCKRVLDAKVVHATTKGILHALDHGTAEEDVETEAAGTALEEAAVPPSSAEKVAFLLNHVAESHAHIRDLRGVMLVMRKRIEDLEGFHAVVGTKTLRSQRTTAELQLKALAAELKFAQVSADGSAKAPTAASEAMDRSSRSSGQGGPASPTDTIPRPPVSSDKRPTIAAGLPRPKRASSGPARALVAEAPLPSRPGFVTHLFWSAPPPSARTTTARGAQSLVNAHATAAPATILVANRLATLPPSARHAIVATSQCTSEPVIQEASGHLEPAAADDGLMLIQKALARHLLHAQKPSTLGTASRGGARPPIGDGSARHAPHANHPPPAATGAAQFAVDIATDDAAAVSQALEGSTAPPKKAAQALPAGLVAPCPPVLDDLPVVEEHAAVFLPVTLLSDIYEAVYDFVACGARTALHARSGTTAYFPPRKFASVIAAPPTADGAVPEEAVPPPAEGPDTNSTSNTNSSSRYIYDTSFVEDFVQCAHEVLLPRLAAIRHITKAHDTVISRLGDAFLSAADRTGPSPSGPTAPPPPTGPKAPRASRGRGGDKSPDAAGSVVLRPSGERPPTLALTTPAEEGQRARELSLHGLIYSILFHTYRLHARFPAARFFLLHLQECVPKIAFLGLRRQQQAVRGRVADMTGATFVVVPEPPSSVPAKESPYRPARSAAASQSPALPPPPLLPLQPADVPDGAVQRAATLNDVVAAVAEELPMYNDHQLRVLHEAFLADTAAMVLLMEGPGPLHFLQTSGKTVAAALSDSIATAASPAFLADGKTSDPAYQLINGCARQLQSIQFDIMSAAASGPFRVEGGDGPLGSVRHCFAHPCSALQQALTQLFLTQQLWTAYTFQAAVREVTSMTTGASAASTAADALGRATTLLKPSHYGPETTSALSLVQALERADPGCRADAIKRFVMEIVNAPGADMGPRQRIAVREFAARLPLVLYQRSAPMPLPKAKQAATAAAEHEGEHAAVTAAVLTPPTQKPVYRDTTAAAGILRALVASQGSLAMDALHHTAGSTDAASNMQLRFTQMPSNVM